MINPFESVELGPLKIKNHFVRSATHDFFGLPQGEISQREIDIVTELAKNNVGCIITALMSVSEAGVCEANQNRLDHDRFIPSLEKMCLEAHQFGSKVIVQLCHGGYKSFPTERVKVPCGPSVIQRSDGQVTGALSVQEIDIIVEDFANAALRAKKAGADGIQIHAAHGYLLTQFLSPIENKRQDHYGGSAENRFRFTESIIQCIKKSCGKEFPILLKINSNLVRGNNKIDGENQTYLDDLLSWIKKATVLKVSAVELSGTGFAQFSKLEEPYFLKQALFIKSHSNMPLILCGGIHSIVEIQNILDNGIEAVSMSRSFISNPKLITEFESGLQQSNCIRCNQCFSLPLSNNRRCVFDHSN